MMMMIMIIIIIIIIILYCTAVRSLKPEEWGSPLVQEKYREEKAYDKRHPYRTIIIELTVLRMFLL